MENPSVHVHLPKLEAFSRSQQVECSLLELISSGTLAKGSRLPTELNLAQQFGVSRVTVREAIARLRADGFVSTKPGRGAVVESVAPRTLRFEKHAGAETFQHLFELRRLIEVEAASLAAQRRDAQSLAVIEAAHEAMTWAAQSGKNAPEIDMAFHRAISAATGNPHLLGLVDFIAGQLQSLFAQAWVNSALYAGGAFHAHGEHALLVAAIREGDAVGARAAATAHLDAAEKRLSRSGPVGPSEAALSQAKF